MPLTPKQKKAVAAGCESCQTWGELLRMRRALGYPDEAAEERQKAAQATYDAAKVVVTEWEAQHGAGK